MTREGSNKPGPLVGEEKEKTRRASEGLSFQRRIGYGAARRATWSVPLVT